MRVIAAGLFEAVEAVLMLAVLAVFVVVYLTRLGLAPVPTCQEDQTLIGSGSFEFGRWSTYVCGPAVDDYVVVP